jgi:hypothetical protein
LQRQEEERRKHEQQLAFKEAQRKAQYELERAKAEKQMEKMINNSNRGLARRFSMEDAFKFSDFTADELWRILILKLRQKEIIA